MGGSIFVGIKQNNKYFLMDRYTNNLPYWFSDPDFQNGGESVQKYIDLERDKMFMKPQSKVHPSQYGVVLVDFDAKKVLSRQGYTKLDHFLFGMFSDSDEIDLIQKILDRDLVEGFYKGTSKGLERIDTELVLGFIKEKDLNKRYDSFRNEGTPGSYLVYLKFKTNLVIDHSGEDAQFNWNEVISWLKDNSWDVKYMSVSAVKKKYGN